MPYNLWLARYKVLDEAEWQEGGVLFAVTSKARSFGAEPDEFVDGTGKYPGPLHALFTFLGDEREQVSFRASSIAMLSVGHQLLIGSDWEEPKPEKCLRVTWAR